MTDDTDMIVRIDTIDQLFNAPAVDPFSDKPAIVLGEAALMYAVREQLGRGLRIWRVRRMIIQLPGDQITPGLEGRVVAAVRRYAEVKYAKNQNLIHISRLMSLVRLAMAIFFVLVILLIAEALENSLLASVPTVVTGALGGLLTIIVWVVLWSPWDNLIYEWHEPTLENILLRRIDKMEIVLRAEPQRATEEMAHSLMPDSSRPEF